MLVGLTRATMMLRPTYDVQCICAKSYHGSIMLPVTKPNAMPLFAAQHSLTAYMTFPLESILAKWTGAGMAHGHKLMYMCGTDVSFFIVCMVHVSRTCALHTCTSTLMSKHQNGRYTYSLARTQL